MFPIANRARAQRRVALAVAGLVLLAYSTPSPAPLIPARKYVLINGSGMILTCTVHGDGKGWSPAFRLSAGAQWNSKDYNGLDRIHFRCGLPVRQQSFLLARGKRYAFLKPANGVIDIVEVTASDDEEL